MSQSANNALGHLSAAESCVESPCQRCERVRLAPKSKWHTLTIARMLYDFHKKQNQKKPGTVHATYLISGTKRKEEPPATIGGVKDVDGDDYMQSSPFMSSSMPQPEEDQGTGESSVLSITLTREEDLESK